MCRRRCATSSRPDKEATRIASRMAVSVRLFSVTPLSYDASSLNARQAFRWVRYRSADSKSNVSISQLGSPAPGAKRRSRSGVLKRPTCGSKPRARSTGSSCVAIAWRTLAFRPPVIPTRVELDPSDKARGVVREHASHDAPGPRHARACCARRPWPYDESNSKPLGIRLAVPRQTTAACDDSEQRSRVRVTRIHHALLGALVTERRGIWFRARWRWIVEASPLFFCV
jgi:hypothetical protein